MKILSNSTQQHSNKFPTFFVVRANQTNKKGKFGFLSLAIINSYNVKNLKNA